MNSNQSQHQEEKALGYHFVGSQQAIYLKDAFEGIGTGKVHAHGNTARRTSRSTFGTRFFSSSLVTFLWFHSNGEFWVSERLSGVLPSMSGPFSSEKGLSGGDIQGDMIHYTFDNFLPYRCHIRVSAANEVGFGSSMYSTPSAVQPLQQG